MRFRRLTSDEKGVAAVEMAFALPVLVVMLYMIVQLGEVYRAMAGIQQALGQGARYATLCVNPSNNGCEVHSSSDITSKMQESVYGVGPGVFTPTTSDLQTQGTTGKYYDLTVEYTQHTSLLLFPGPDIDITRSKRVWVAGD